MNKTIVLSLSRPFSRAPDLRRGRSFPGCCQQSAFSPRVRSRMSRGGWLTTSRVRRIWLGWAANA